MCSFNYRQYTCMFNRVGCLFCWCWWKSLPSLWKPFFTMWYSIESSIWVWNICLYRGTIVESGAANYWLRELSHPVEEDALPPLDKRPNVSTTYVNIIKYAYLAPMCFNYERKLHTGPVKLGCVEVCWTRDLLWVKGCFEISGFVWNMFLSLPVFK